MIVVYLKADERVLGWAYGSIEVTENSIEGGGLKMTGVNFALVSYGFYKDKEIRRKYETDESGETSPTPIYLNELNLEPITADDLPVSEHIGKLIAVNISAAKPATVRRRFMGVNYDVQCLVSQSVKNLYQSGDIQLGDFVLVSFIEEHPNETERSVAIITDKVYQSW